MDKSSSKQFFETAYATGTDTWSHLPLKLNIIEEIRKLPKDSFILDTGSGRGIWPFQLAELGYKVIGIDYSKNIVDKNNTEVKFRGLSGRIRFMEADALDIPFEDASFDAVTDLGLLQHFLKSDWSKYVGEISRVLKKDGLLLVVALSRETKTYFGWMPHVSPDGDFVHENVPYHFFTKEEMGEVFKNGFEMSSQKIEHIEGDDSYFLITVFRKK